MIDRHIIRLRGPWWGSLNPTGKDLRSDAGDQNADFKTTCPFVGQGHFSDDFAGTVRLVRKFNGSPGMIQADQVWLTIESAAVPTEVIFNGEPLNAASPQSSHLEISINSLLTRFNRLELVLQLNGDSNQGPALSGPLVGEVAIEIGP